MKKIILLILLFLSSNIFAVQLGQGQGDKFIYNTEFTERTKILNKVYINSLDDLPAAIGDTIYLEDYTDYYFDSSVTIYPASKLRLGYFTRVFDAILISASSIVFTDNSNLINTRMTYVGTGNAVESEDIISGVIRIDSCDIIAPYGQAFSLYSTNPQIVVLINEVAVYTANKLGGFSGIGVSMTQLNCLNFNDGFDFQDNFGGLDLDTVRFFFSGNVTGNKYIDIFGSYGALAPIGQISINKILATPKNNEYVFNFDKATTAYQGVIGTNCPISLIETGATTANIFAPDSATQKDIGFKFSANTTIPDSTSEIHLFCSSNTSTTLVPDIDTPVTANISGIVSELSSERFSFSTANNTVKITYIGQTEIVSKIRFSVTLQPSSGINKELAVYVALNGVLEEDSERVETISSGKDGVIEAFTIIKLQQNDFLECYVENHTLPAVDILISKISCYVFE